MSHPSHRYGGSPAYVRQDSFDSAPPPPQHQDLGYYGLSHPPPQLGRGSSPSGPSTRSNSNSPVTRRQTVRGAVRGTIREAGAAAPVRQATVGPNRALTRGRTLTRPERFVAPAPLINPKNDKSGAYTTTLVNGVPTLQHNASPWDSWGMFVTVITCWAPCWLLTSCGLTDPLKQRAWKEKVALCMIAAVMMGVIGFITIGLNRVLCPVNGARSTSAFIRIGSTPGLVGIAGWNFNTSKSTSAPVLAASNALGGSDISDLFNRQTTSFPRCTNKTAAYVTADLCTKTTSAVCTLGAPTAAVIASLGLVNTTKLVGYDWNQLQNLTNYLVIDGNVLNLNPYMAAHPKAIPNDAVDGAIRYVLRTIDATGGKDATRIFYNSDELKASVNCLVQRYYAGHIDKITPGCFVSQLFLYVSLALIMSIVMARFFMACVFNWYLSAKLVQAPKNLKRHVISPAVLPEGANIDVDNTTGAAPWVDQQVKRQATQRLRRAERGGKNGAGDKGRDAEKLAVKAAASETVGPDGMISMASIGPELFCVCLITCYSEGAEGIRSTLDSIAGTTYSDARKLIFVVCDGMITGEGENMSTPDICVGLLEADPRFGEPQAMSYIAIGDGSKAHNQAMIYAGHYTNVKGHRTPTLVVVKCGPPEEAKDKKPGNRGKRDSQMILMNFFSRVTYNDRMCPLDYDLFRKVQSLMGVTPDFFEVCLMVDADTKVYPDSLGYLVRTMQNDNMIMGVCGETRIANKRQSWVTAIQVFEYFISHHLAKAFESVFGGVTCLPGCFSMYRLKARKSNDSDWFPILVQPQIVSEYSQSIVTTLHQKNLLLLGEDRFLTTLLLRTFPNRKMMFCPQARCRTVAPDTFSVLLSQRRRWINSTIHNLMELVLVRSLCGSFCFSMQFILVVDLIGTVVLPIAICLTYTLIINYIFNPPSSFSDAIPLLLLGAVLGLPAVLILITTFKIVYVGWMLVYLIALPIWNFVLPLYAFSKFDDFSWGATRLVQGEVKGDDGHGPGTGIAQNVPLRRWEDWERSRLRKIKRDDKRRREFERSFGTKQFHGSSRDGYEDSVAPSDTASLFSEEGDRWGLQIGQYSEDGPTAAPPPVGLYDVEEGSEGHETIQAHEMELVLEQGWGDEPRNYGYVSPVGYNSSWNPAPPPPLQSLGPQRLYSLTDNGSTRMEKSYSASSQQHLNNSSATSLNSSYGHDPFLGGQPSSPTPYALASSAYPNEARSPLQSSPGMSTGVGRNLTGGHAKQRSLSGGSGESALFGNGGDGSRTPSPGRDRYNWEEREQPSYGGAPTGQGRRLA